KPIGIDFNKFTEENLLNFNEINKMKTDLNKNIASSVLASYALTDVLLQCSLNKYNNEQCVDIYKKLGRLLGKILKDFKKLNQDEKIVDKYLLQWNILGTAARELKAKQAFEQGLADINIAVKMNYQ